MRELVEEWIAHLKHVRRASANTCCAYRADLGGLEEFTRPAIRRFLAEQHGKVSGKTVARRLYALRGFGDWLVTTGRATDNPARGIRLPKQQSRVPRVLAVDEAFRVLAVPDRLTVTGARDAALLELLYGGGLRVSEAVGLDLVDLDLVRGEARIRQAKGNKDRVTVIGRVASDAIGAYLLRRRELHGADGQALFLSQKGGRLTDRQAHRIVEGAGRAAGIAGLHPHALRHSCASHLLRAGADLRGIQEQLGHSSVSTTVGYLSVDQEALQQSYRRAHPLAGLRLDAGSDSGSEGE